MPRFFVSKENIDTGAGTAFITGDDAHHIARSLRMAEGGYVTVCDGCGNDYGCVLSRIRDDRVDLTVESCSPTPSEPPYTATVYQALVKGDRMDTAIQKSVECGAAEIRPFESSRCIVRIGDESENKSNRRRKIAAEAAKQCGRGIIPPVGTPVSFADMLKSASEKELALFCYEDEKTVTLGSLLREKECPREIAVVIGPEGGFSPEEAKKAEECGLVPVSLGRRILRTESAAPFVLAALSTVYEL